MQQPFSARVDAYRNRVEAYIEQLIPAAGTTPEGLHSAMRYAVLDGGKRLRPLLVYAAGECLGVDAARLDAPAASVELIHAFSLVHDDLPAMDDDELRRGRPTVHRHFGEATAILAGDALLPLAFEAIVSADGIDAEPRAALVALIAAASGSLGMTGGQALDLAAEGSAPTRRELERIHALKTGALIHASVRAAACLAERMPAGAERALDEFGYAIGLAFQIRDDLLDVEGDTFVIGKQAGSDASKGKATWPALFGVDDARRRCAELVEAAADALEPLGPRAASLRWAADFVVARDR